MGNNISQTQDDVFFINLENLPESLSNLKDDIRKLMLEKIDKIQEEYNITILWLVESSSKSWGIQCDDLSCNIRGIFRYNDKEKLKQLTIPNNKVNREINGDNDQGTISWKIWEEGYAQGSINYNNLDIIECLNVNDNFIYYSINNSFEEWKNKYNRNRSNLTKHHFELMRTYFDNDIDPNRTNFNNNNIDKNIKHIQHNLQKIRFISNNKNMENNLLKTSEMINNIVNVAKIINIESNNTRNTSNIKIMYLVRSYLILKYIQAFPDNDYTVKSLDDIINELENINKLDYVDEIRELLESNEEEEYECPEWVVQLYNSMSKSIQVKRKRKKDNSKTLKNNSSKDVENTENIQNSENSENVEQVQNVEKENNIEYSG